MLISLYKAKTRWPHRFVRFVLYASFSMWQAAYPYTMMPDLVNDAFFIGLFGGIPIIIRIFAAHDKKERGYCEVNNLIGSENQWIIRWNGLCGTSFLFKRECRISSKTHVVYSIANMFCGGNLSVPPFGLKNLF